MPQLVKLRLIADRTEFDGRNWLARNRLAKKFPKKSSKKIKISLAELAKSLRDAGILIS